MDKNYHYLERPKKDDKKRVPKEGQQLVGESQSYSVGCVDKWKQRN